MARIVGGIGTSHSPMLSLPGEAWSEYGRADARRADLVYPPDGLVLSYAEGVRHSETLLKDRRRDQAAHVEQYQRCRAALAALAADLDRLDPDIVVMVSDDQGEWFYDDNMPMFSVFWGDSIPLVPRPPVAGRPAEMDALIAAGYGDKAMDVPVATDLARFVLGYLVDHDFDIAQSAYLNERYGGRVALRLAGPDGPVEVPREVGPRRQGLPHGFSFVIKNLLGNQPRPIVPISQNTCYPPNVAPPRRCYALGQALGQAVAEWESDARVVFVASGGLSHFVTDEELDRRLLDAIARDDADALRSLPRQRLYSGTSESLNWVTVAGAMAAAGLGFEVVDYVPVYRTDAATGGGWAFGRWTWH
jgi:3-O-methylgallate 3,4-dioxygenase